MRYNFHISILIGFLKTLKVSLVPGGAILYVSRGKSPTAMVFMEEKGEQTASASESLERLAKLLGLTRFQKRLGNGNGANVRPLPPPLTAE